MSTPPPTRQRTSFTNAQRLQICCHKEQNPTITQGQLATWAQETLNLPRKPSQAMISKLLKRKPDLETMTTEELTCKSRRTVRFPNLDTALARWVSYCEETGVPVTGESIRTKAGIFADILNIDTPLTFSNGWLYKFNERHGFGGLKGHKERKLSIEQLLHDLQRRLRNYDPKNVFSMDETGLFFTMFPDRTARMTKRLTITLACNADGSEKLPPLFIGKSEKPRGFSSSTTAELNYLHNSNALMTREIFIKWVKDLDDRFQERQRHCALVIDSTAVHVGFDVHELKNIEIVYLPPGTPNNLLPFATGIVTAFKKRYRRRQIQYALDQLDADADMSTVAKFDSVGVKLALSWCIESWAAVPPSLITSCWYDTGLVYAEQSGFSHEYRGQEESISEELAVMLSWLHAAVPLTVDELLDLPEESIIMEEPTDEDFCASVGSMKLIIPQLKLKSPDTDGGLPVEELKERLKWIAKLLIYADEKDIPAESVSGMRVLQRDFRDQLNKKQAGANAP